MSPYFLPEPLKRTRTPKNASRKRSLTLRNRRGTNSQQQPDMVKLWRALKAKKDAVRWLQKQLKRSRIAENLKERKERIVENASLFSKQEQLVYPPQNRKAVERKEDMFERLQGAYPFSTTNQHFFRLSGSCSGDRYGCHSQTSRHHWQQATSAWWATTFFML